MKKLVLILSFITGISVMAQAQITQKSPEQRAAHFTKVLQKTLHLNADQASKINAAYYSQATQMDSLKNNLSPDKKTNNLSRRSIMLATQQQVMQVLTGDQQKQFMQWEQMRKEKHQANKGIVPPVQG